MGYVFRRPWPDWRRSPKYGPFILPPEPEPPEPPPAPSRMRDRRGVIVAPTDPSQLSDPHPRLAWKTAVRLATTGPITLKGLQTIDGVATAIGDRVLVKDQPTAFRHQNGFYSVATGHWQRAADANGNIELAPGTQVYVRAGELNARKIFVLDLAGPIVIGTTALVFTERFYPLTVLPFVLDGGGLPLQVGDSYTLEVPWDCTVVRSTLMANAAGSATLSVRRAGFADYPADPGESICGDAPPVLDNERKLQDDALEGWSTLLRRGDLVTARVTAVTGIGFLTLSLLVSRS